MIDQNSSNNQNARQQKEVRRVIECEIDLRIEANCGVSNLLGFGGSEEWSWNCQVRLLQIEKLRERAREREIGVLEGGGEQWWREGESNAYVYIQC